jgi:hypothetical protein
MRIGDRIELLSMPDDPDPIPVGTRGTITYVGSELPSRRGPSRQYGVKWDNGRTLGLACPPDRVRRLPDA